MKNLFLPVLVFAVLNCTAQEKKIISLSEAMNMAVKNNHALKASYQQVQMAKGNLKENAFLPSPSINADFMEVPTGESISGSNERTLGVQQQLEFPLRYPYKIKALRAGISAAELGYRQDELALKAQTRNAYVQWLGAINLVQLAKENLKLAGEFSASSEKLYEAGEIGAIPLSQARINVSQAKLQYNTAINNEVKARTELHTILGIGNTIILEPADSLSAVSMLNAMPALYDSLQQVNLQYSNSLVLSSRASLAYQRTAFLPDITLEYARQRIDGQNGFYGIGIGVNIPLWFFSQQGSIQRSKAQFIQDRENYLQTQITISNRWKAVQAALAQYQENINQYKEISAESLTLVQNAKKAYDAGELSYLEYITAQQTYIQSKNIYIDNLLNYQLSLTDYYTITGGL